MWENLKITGNHFLLCLLFLISPCFSHAQFFEDFKDGELLKNPQWEGDVNIFRTTSSTAIPVEMRPALQLYDSVTNTAYLSSKLMLSNVDSLQWNFWVKLSFNPSVNNYARFYLISDSKDLISAPKGLFVSIGENSKKVSLYSQENDSIILLIEGPVINKLTNVVRVQVRKDILNNFTFFVDTLGESKYIFYGEETVDFEYYQDSYLGLYCKYTKSNAAKIYWDDISVRLVEQDTVKPKLESFEIVEPNFIHLYFSEELDSVSANNDFNYLMNPHLEPIYALLEHNKVTLAFYPDFEKDIEYMLIINGISDKAGNVMEEKGILFILRSEEEKAKDSLKYFIQPEDILINEVLFNPFSNGSDFVEIYNNTEKDFYLDSLCLATWDINTQELKTIIPIGDDIIFEPYNYLVLTKDKDNIISNYHVPYPDKIHQLKSLPSYPNKEGVVILCTKSGKIIDRFDYNEKIHFQLLSNYQGISLERRSFEKPTNENSNWQSASKTSGWATPTYRNSQYSDFLYLEEPFTMDPNPFSPDLDGVDDFLNIHYKLNEEGLLCNLVIYDSHGKVVRNLKRNEYLGREGTFVWDGVNEHGRKSPVGNYIVYIEVFTLKGDVKHYKKVVTLLGK